LSIPFLGWFLFKIPVFIITIGLTVGACSLLAVLSIAAIITLMKSLTNNSHEPSQE
jgi:hypothetical protein